MIASFAREAGEFVFQLAFFLIMGLLVIGGPVMAVILARAAFKDSGPASPAEQRSEGPREDRESADRR
jgi:hypothetical protein